MELRGAGITVFCGSSAGNHPRFLDAARELGCGIALGGATLVYGGASVGLMGALADAALGAGGPVVGVMPRTLVDREIGHSGLTELVVVDTLHQRKAVMSARAAAFIALPGGFGTYEETLEVVTHKQVGLHRKPVVILDLGGFYTGLLAQVDRAVADGFMHPSFRDYVIVVDSVARALETLGRYKEPADSIAKFT